MRRFPGLLTGFVLGVSTVFVPQLWDGATTKQVMQIFRPARVAAEPGPSIQVEYPEVQVQVRAQIVHLGRAQTVHLGETIRVSVLNGLKRPIFTDTNRADCSIVMLERWTGEAWVGLPACAATKLPLIVSIRPGQRVEISLRPGSKNLQWPGTNSTILRAGLHRFDLSYRFRAVCDSDTAEIVESYSQSFRVVP